jgi:putative nucleotidyltransferase with HDIG domain
MAAVLVGAVFGVVVTVSRNQVRQTVREHLESSQQMIAELQSREQRGLRLQAENIAESPTLKAAIDTYAAESRTATASERMQLLNTITGELEKMAGRVDADVLIAVDAHRRTLAAAGRLASAWPAGRRLPPVGNPDDPVAYDGVMHAGNDLFRVVTAPLLLGDGSSVGTLYLATSLDQQFAERLGTLARTYTAILSRGELVASTLSPTAQHELKRPGSHLADDEGTVILDGESHAFRRLVTLGDTTFYALTSIDASARMAIRQTTVTLVFVALGALSLALIGSIGLAHLMSRPIERLSASIHDIARTRQFHASLPLSGSSRELDALTETFNTLMFSVAAAEAETQVAYTAAIRGLAATLDARDPYTAGHSERVSVLSVAVGKVMNLPASELEVVRLGALLHDIGKIGVPDEILRKPGPLEPEEYAVLQQHPVLGARILGTVPFLARHLPIVELHHERPDGRGYPHGLRGDEIPLPARIVHAADAFDAMTSARAYRPERPADEALRELWACVGTEFHVEVVEALTEAITGRPFMADTTFEEALSA